MNNTSGNIVVGLIHFRGPRSISLVISDLALILWKHL